MKRFPLVIGAFAAFAVGVAVQAVLELEDIAQFLRVNMPWIIIALIAVLVVLGAVLWATTVFLRRKAHKYLQVEGTLSDEELVENVINQVTSPDTLSLSAQNATLVSFGAWLLRREANKFYFNVTVTVMGGLIGTTTLFLLYEQNKLIFEQNRKITLQTDANITESVLLEGTRRAALAGDMESLFAEIRGEAQRKLMKPCKNPRPDPCLMTEMTSQLDLISLSDRLSSRVRSFSLRNTPYRLAVGAGDELNFEQELRHQYAFPNLSPERGQLLETLVRNGVFAGAYDLRFAQVSGSELVGKDFSYSILDGADFSDANLRGAVFFDTSLAGANLANARIANANLQSANLYSAILKHAILGGSQLSEARLIFADLTRANLTYANLENATMRNTKMHGARLVSANLTGADLRGAALSGLTELPEDLMSYGIVPPPINEYSEAVAEETLKSDHLRAEHSNISLPPPLAANMRATNISSANFLRAELDGVSFSESWAWHDMPPIGLPEDAMYITCEFIEGTHRRGVLPDECKPDSLKDR